MMFWNYVGYSIWLAIVITVYIAYNYIFETKTTLKPIWCKVFGILVAIVFAILCNLYAM